MLSDKTANLLKSAKLYCNTKNISIMYKEV